MGSILRAELRRERPPAQRWKAIRDLGERRAIDALADLTSISLNDEDSAMREEALRAVANFETDAVAETLLRAVATDPSTEVRCAAAELLGRWSSDERVIEALVAALGDRSSRVQRAAAAAIGASGNPRAVEAIIAALTGTSPFVQDEIAKALGRFGSIALEPVLRCLEIDGPRPAIVAALSAIGSTNLECLIAQLRSPLVAVREGLALALGPTGDERALPALRAATDDPDPRVVSAAIAALGCFDSDLAVEALSKTAARLDPAVRAKSATALAEIGSVTAIQVLLRLFADTDEGVRRAAESGAATLGEFATAALIEALRKEDWRVRESAARALGGIVR